MRVLIIKLTSMGDLMHAFPALTDAVERIPNIQFDWVVDESFAEVPQWHPAVKQVITTAHRRWRKNILATIKLGEFGTFYRNLNAKDYDVIIDMQSNLKSAFVSWLRRGDIHSYDRHTCRERPAHWAYDRQYHIPLRQHAIERQRELFANIFDYDRPKASADYGVDLSHCILPDSISSESLGTPLSLPKKYLVFVHNASWPTKLWPVEYWQQLAAYVVSQGYSVLLPCGSDTEHQRALAIANEQENVIALPKLSLNTMAAIMSNAKAAVCSDTGLAHMAAVTSTPAITLYAVTDTLLIGTEGRHQQHIDAGTSTLNKNNASMADITVDRVWTLLQSLLA